MRITPLFDEEFFASKDRQSFWNSFLRKIKYPESIDFQTVGLLIRDRLLAAYQAEVEYRCRHFTTCEEFESQREQIARFLTGNSEKFGLFFSGMCGNGKTTWLKAIRT